jgi:hypothetical protein
MRLPQVKMLVLSVIYVIKVEEFQSYLSGTAKLEDRKAEPSIIENGIIANKQPREASQLT